MPELQEPIDENLIPFAQDDPMYYSIKADEWVRNYILGVVDPDEECKRIDLWMALSQLLVDVTDCEYITECGCISPKDFIFYVRERTDTYTNYYYLDTDEYDCIQIIRVDDFMKQIMKNIKNNEDVSKKVWGGKKIVPGERGSIFRLNIRRV